jgi:hypothetical protein
MLNLVTEIKEHLDGRFPMNVQEADSCLVEIDRASKLLRLKTRELKFRRRRLLKRAQKTGQGLPNQALTGRSET